MKGSPVATFCTLAESINFINMMNTQLYLCSAALLLTAAQTKAADKQKERRVSEKGALIFFVKVRTFASSDFFISSKMFILEHVNR